MLAVAVLSQCTHIGGINSSQMGISANKPLNQPVSSQVETKAISYASIVDLAIMCCFLDL